MARMICRVFMLCILLLGGLQRSAIFAADAPPNETRSASFLLYPAPQPIAALEYRLLPQYADLTPGNAAPLYLKAELLIANTMGDKIWRKIIFWSETPPDTLPKNEVRSALAKFATPLSYVKLAAHRERCDWDEPVRETEHPFEIQLPEMQNIRNLAWLVALQARLQIAEDRPTDAIETLQIGYAMAVHASKCSFLVSALVGQSVAGIMNVQLETVIQSKDCPNLYWSLKALPHPLIDYHRALEEETASIYEEFSQLRGVESANRTPEQWQAELNAFVLRWNKRSPMPGVGTTLALSAIVSSWYPKAKDWLIHEGGSHVKVEAMSPPQAILTYTALRFQRSYDEVLKWFGLPYWQAREPMAAATADVAAEARTDHIPFFPVTATVMPSFVAVRAVQARYERTMAALEIVELIRMYAAAHDGKLPANLQELKEAPAPLDPVTGKPFDYRIANGKALLDGTEPAGHISLHYEIAIAPAKK